MPPFPHSGSVPCRCPYKERIVRQTTVARTPNHQFVDGCRPALPPRLWHPRSPEGGEATVIYVEGSLKFPNSYRVSQLDAVLRHTQDHENTWPLTQVRVLMPWPLTSSRKTSALWCCIDTTPKLTHWVGRIMEVGASYFPPTSH